MATEPRHNKVKDLLLTSCINITIINELESSFIKTIFKLQFSWNLHQVWWYKHRKNFKCPESCLQYSTCMKYDVHSKSNLSKSWRNTPIWSITSSPECFQASFYHFVSVVRSSSTSETSAAKKLSTCKNETLCQPYISTKAYYKKFIYL